MSLDWVEVFKLASLAVLPAWLYLIAGPRSVPMLNTIVQYVWPAAMALSYAVIVLSNLGGFDTNDFQSLAGVRSIFSGDAALTAGWMHYLAFDLFVGGWIAREADAMGLWRLAQVPILLATFVFGPLGFLIFVTIQAIRLLR